MHRFALRKGEWLYFEKPILINRCLHGFNFPVRKFLSVSKQLGYYFQLAKAGVTALHFCGSPDPGFKNNTGVLERLYKKMGGQITVIFGKDEGHYLLAPKDLKPVVDFITGRVN